MLDWYKVFLLIQIDKLEKKYNKKLNEIESRYSKQIKAIYKYKKLPFKNEQPN